MGLTDEELDEIFVAYSKRVSVSCNEAHQHTALKGCLHSDHPADVVICKLAETLKNERKLVREAAGKLGKR